MNQSLQAPCLQKSGLQRSILAVPASSPRFFKNAAEGEADSIFLDLEDSVAPDKKVEARGVAIEALNSMDWQDKDVTVRINEVDSPWNYKDIVDIVEQCPRLDALLVPKVGDGEDIRFVARLLDALEANNKRDKPVRIDALIETPVGLTNVDAIASSSDRLKSLAFGVGDYSVAMQAPQTDYGSPDPAYGVLTGNGDENDRLYHWNDQWHYALARIANACRASGIRPLDGPFTNVNDIQGYQASARRARALGFEGKWAIHPAQLVHANEIFSPSEPEIIWAKRINEAMNGALENGNGAVLLDGKMIDLAHVKQASALLYKQDIIAGKGSA